MNGHDVPELVGNRAGGQVELAIGIERGQVVIRFQLPQTRVSMDPTNAARVGKELIDRAVDLGARVAIIPPPRKITDQMRKALIARIQHVIRSTQDQNRPPEYVAMAVFDSVINGIDG